MSSHFFGPLGSMERVVVSAGVTTETARAFSEFISGGGVRHVQRGRAAPRSWTVGRVYQGPDWARLLGLAAHGLLPDCWLYDVAAARENMIPSQLSVGSNADTLIRWVRRNLATNPSFESGAGMGGAVTSAGSAVVGVSTDWAGSGTQSLKISGNGVLEYPGAYPWGGIGPSVMTRMGVQAGKTYTVSADFYQFVPQASSWATGARCMWFGPSIGAAWGKSADAPNIPGVHRIKCTFTIPAGTTSMAAAFTLGSKESTGYFDRVLIEEGTTDGTYFDGSAPGASWDGIPNASASVLAGQDFYPAQRVLVGGLPMTALRPGHTVQVPVLAGRLYTASVWADESPGSQVATYQLGTQTPQSVLSAPGSGSRSCAASFTPMEDTIATITTTAQNTSGLRLHDGPPDGLYFAGHGTPCKVAVQDPVRTLHLVTEKVRSDYQVTLQEVGKPGQI